HVGTTVPIKVEKKAASTVAKGASTVVPDAAHVATESPVPAPAPSESAALIISESAPSNDPSKLLEQSIYPVVATAPAPVLFPQPAALPAAAREETVYVLRANHFGGLGWMTSRRVFYEYFVPYM
ncbi:unnamed protein product, partial [Amoebophrya sp. A25]